MGLFLPSRRTAWLSGIRSDSEGQRLFFFLFLFFLSSNMTFCSSLLITWEKLFCFVCRILKIDI